MKDVLKNNNFIISIWVKSSDNHLLFKAKNIGWPCL